MSKSSRKRQLVAEAMDAYKEAVQRSNEPSEWDDNDWNFLLPGIFCSHGWYVTHPGSDKWIAFKGPVVAKWIGNCEWSDNAIRDMLRIRRVLKKRGMIRMLPRMYAHVGSRFIVEQRCKTNSGFKKRTVTYKDYAIIRAKLTSNGLCILDLAERNMGRVNNRLKVIDGKIHVNT